MTSLALAGIFRSLRQYHGDADRQDAMDRLYGHFLAPGDLAFDIGAHVGDRTSSFRRLGASVVTVEPQPLAFRALRLIHGGDAHVKLIQAACSDNEGCLELRINSANPTVSTASSHFTQAADGAIGWQGQHWDTTHEVPAVTMDGLIAEYGEPVFTKIDVEGFEPSVLAGLTHPLPALSFEFTTIQRELVPACVDRLQTLGPYRFNLALGESQRFEFTTPINADEMLAFVNALPHEANSGDIYALAVDD